MPLGYRYANTGQLVARKLESHLRPEATHALHDVFLAGSLTRSAFKFMTGLVPRSADRLLAELLRRELLLSETPKGPVRFGIPLWVLRFFQSVDRGRNCVAVLLQRGGSVWKPGNGA